MEIINQTTTREYLGNGKYTDIISQMGNYFKNGIWRVPTNNLKNSGDPNFQIGVNELFDFRIKDKLSGNSPVVHIGKGNTQVRYTPLNTNNVNGIVVNNKIRFNEAWNNADLEIEICSDIIKKNIYLKNNHPKTFSFRIDSKQNINDDLESNEFSMLKPYLYNYPNESIYLDWQKSYSGNKLILTVTIPDGNWSGWTLDPTFSAQAGDGTDISEDYFPDNNKNGSDRLRAVWRTVSASQWEAFLKFDVSSIPSSSTINSATLETKTVWIYNTGYDVDIYRLRRAWVNTQITWNLASTGVNWGTAGAKNSSSDYYNTVMGSYTPASIGNWNTTSLDTSEVTNWLTTNNGMVVRRTNSVADNYDYQFYSFYTSTATDRPKLTIIYTPASRVYGPAVQSM